jgi:hypothetical protein
MLFLISHLVQGIQEAEVSIDTFTPGETLSESNRSTDPFIQGFCEDIRLELMGFEERIVNHIVRRCKYLLLGFLVPTTVLNIALTAVVLYR